MSRNSKIVRKHQAGNTKQVAGSTKEKRQRAAKLYNDDLNTIINFHNLYFKQTRQQARFNRWLSRELGVPVDKISFRDKVNNYFTALFRALRGL